MSTREHLLIAGVDIMLCEKMAQIIQRHLAGRIPLKRLLDQWCPLAINSYAFGAVIIKIANGSGAGIFAAPDFFAETTLRVFGKRIHIIFTESEFAMKHELSLGRVFKPRTGEFERVDLAGVEHVDDPPAVHAVAGEAVGMPCKDAAGFAGLNALQHRVKNRPAGCFSGLLLNQLGDDVNLFAPGKLAQFIQLCVNGEDLLVLDIGGFSGVEK